MHPVFVSLAALHAASCLALAVAGVLCHRHPQEDGTRNFLFPFIVAAGALGLLNLYPFAMELFVAWYSGAISELDGVIHESGGVPLATWARIGLHTVAALLPLAGLVPACGRKPLLMTTLGVLAMMPWAIWILMSLS